jgi:hypothetical protein
VWFYIRSIVALALIYLVTYAVEPSGARDALRVAIWCGIALACVKMVLRYFGISTGPVRPPR